MCRPWFTVMFIFWKHRRKPFCHMCTCGAERHASAMTPSSVYLSPCQELSEWTRRVRGEPENFSFQLELKSSQLSHFADFMRWPPFPTMDTVFSVKNYLLIVISRQKDFINKLVVVLFCTCFIIHTWNFVSYFNVS